MMGVELKKTKQSKSAICFIWIYGTTSVKVVKMSCFTSVYICLLLHNGGTTICMERNRREGNPVFLCEKSFLWVLQSRSSFSSSDETTSLSLKKTKNTAGFVHMSSSSGMWRQMMKMSGGGWNFIKWSNTQRLLIYSQLRVVQSVIKD